MATQNVIYFTAGPVATNAELLAIGKIVAATEQPYAVKVFNGIESPNYGAGKAPADLVAGTVPSAYTGTPILDPDNIPIGPPLPATSAIVANGGNVTVKNSAGTVTKTGVATVAASAISGVALEATEAIVSNAQAVTMQNSAGAAIAGTHPATVAAGVVSNVRLAATIAPVANAQNITMQNSAGTAIAGNHPATVAAGVVSNVRLAATVAAVANGAALVVPVTGTYATTATVAVANGVVTGITLS